MHGARNEAAGCLQHPPCACCEHPLPGAVQATSCPSRQRMRPPPGVIKQFVNAVMSVRSARACWRRIAQRQALFQRVCCWQTFSGLRSRSERLRSWVRCSQSAHRGINRRSGAVSPNVPLLVTAWCASDCQPVSNGARGCAGLCRRGYRRGRVIVDALRRAPEMQGPLGTYMYNRSEGSSCTWMLNTSLGPPGTIPGGPASVTQRAHMLRPGRHLHTLLLCCCFCCRTYTRPRCTSSPRSRPATQPTPAARQQPATAAAAMGAAGPRSATQQLSTGDVREAPTTPPTGAATPLQANCQPLWRLLPLSQAPQLLPLLPGGQRPSWWGAPLHQPLHAWHSYTPTRHLQCCWLLLISCCRCSRPAAAAAADQVAASLPATSTASAATTQPPGKEGRQPPLPHPPPPAANRPLLGGAGKAAGCPGRNQHPSKSRAQHHTPAPCPCPGSSSQRLLAALCSATPAHSPLRLPPSSPGHSHWAEPFHHHGSRSAPAQAAALAASHLSPTSAPDPRGELRGRGVLR